MIKPLRIILLILPISLLWACNTNLPMIQPGSNTPPSTSLNAFNQEILNSVNTARATARSCGGKSYPAVAALAWNSKLEAAARAHNQDMLDHNFFDHTGSDGSSPWDRFKRQGYALGSGGENIARGQPTLQAVINAWLSSPGHCANIMGANFSEIGVAALYPNSSPNSPYWTMDLASPR